ncbi:MAG: poly-gamma-glutamate system protein [Burkholderiaceae bacterium]|nr:poly-gamma-glutamate system protein [Burkholderiaceae bacterium]
MKKVYWRPKYVSRTALLLITAISLAGLLWVEFNKVPVRQRYYPEKLAAAELAAKCMEHLRQVRLDRELEIDPENDPAESGLIGLAMSSATSTYGMLRAKQLSVNPNFAAAIVEMLMQIGVQPGDTVAIGYSGSFPAINVCVVAALETLKLKPIGISSAAASQWGANLPDFLWLDMERSLNDAELISFRSSAASLGGVEDRGLGMDTDTLDALMAGIERAELPLVTPPDTDETFTQSVQRRMDLYSKKAAGARIKAYINVGGGTTSVGKSLGKHLIHSGPNYTLPKAARDIDSVMTRFLARDIPVIHLVRVEELAERYGLSVDAERTQVPEPGEGLVFFRRQYNTYYVLAVLAIILGSLYAFIRSDWGFRIFQTNNHRSGPSHPEPMV